MVKGTKKRTYSGEFRVAAVRLATVEKVPAAKYAAFVKERFDFSPRAFIERLDLLRPIYAGTTDYGHFGKPGLPWEAMH